MNSSYILLLIYTLDVMILKRNKFVIQWRKFDFKMSYIFERYGILNLLDFSRILFDFYSYLK